MRPSFPFEPCKPKTGQIVDDPLRPWDPDIDYPSGSGTGVGPGGSPPPDGFPGNGYPEIPLDGRNYVRTSFAGSPIWSAYDPPDDGSTYVRKYKSWLKTSSIIGDDLIALTTELQVQKGDYLARFQEEAYARISGDEAEAGHRMTLEASVRDEVAARVYQEELARVTADSAEASARELITATLRNETNTKVDAAISTERVVRVTAESAIAQSVFDLKTSFTGYQSFIGDPKVYTDAQISTTYMAISNAIAAEVTRVDSLLAGYVSSNDVDGRILAASNAEVISRNTAIANAVGAQASRIDILQAYTRTGYAVNLLKNPAFNRLSFDFWARNNPSYWVIPGFDAGVGTYVAHVTRGPGDWDFLYQDIPVYADHGYSYSFEGHFNTGTCYFQIQWYSSPYGDTSGSIRNDSWTPANNGWGGRIESPAFLSPPGTMWARFVLWIQSDNFGNFTRFQFQDGYPTAYREDAEAYDTRAYIKETRSVATDAYNATASINTALYAGAGSFESRLTQTSYVAADARGRTSAFFGIYADAGGGVAYVNVYADGYGAGVILGGNVRITGDLAIDGTFRTGALQNNSITGFSTNAAGGNFPKTFSLTHPTPYPGATLEVTISGISDVPAGSSIRAIGNLYFNSDLVAAGIRLGKNNQSNTYSLTRLTSSSGPLTVTLETVQDGSSQDGPGYIDCTIVIKESKR